MAHHAGDHMGEDLRGLRKSKGPQASAFLGAQGGVPGQKV